METQLDVARTEAFAARMQEMLNSASLALMTSVGHRTGLFDAMAGMRPATSAQIAEAAGLHERYVREWLGAMVTGRFVEYDPQARTYFLPPEHSAWLTRASGPNNIATYAQYVPVMAGVEDEIVRCFRLGGGVPYSKFARFHDVMAEDSLQAVVSVLEEMVLPLVPGLRERLEQGIDVLDVGCGRGKAMIRLAQSFPNSRFSGYDFSYETIGGAQMEAGELGLRNARFVCVDAAQIDEAEQYDLIFTFDAIHDQAKPGVVLGNIRAALRPDGVYVMQDISGSSRLEQDVDHPSGPFLYAVSTMHCMAVSLAAGGEGLGTMWGKEMALAMLADAGFANVEVHQLPHDATNYYYVCRKS